MKKVFSVAIVMTTLISTNVMAETIENDQITIGGSVVEKTCTVGDGINTDINLAPITVEQVKNAAIGEYLGDKAASFNIHDCPQDLQIRVRLTGETLDFEGLPLVNELKPSGDVVAHYFEDAVEQAPLVTDSTVLLPAAVSEQASTPGGYDYPVNVGYVKIADVKPGTSPAGKTRSIVTLSIIIG